MHIATKFKISDTTSKFLTIAMFLHYLACMERFMAYLLTHFCYIPGRNSSLGTANKPNTKYYTFQANILLFFLTK